MNGPGGERLLTAVLRRDRAVIIAGVVILSLLAWAWVVQDAGQLTGMIAQRGMPGMVMPDPEAWPASRIPWLISMWSVMMVAMMLPGASPVLLLYAALGRQRRADANPVAPTAVFLLGYFTVWTGFSVVAALAQWYLHRTAWLSPSMAASSVWLGGVLLLAAGIYQWLPAKRACLAHCLSPLGFITVHWRSGTLGAFRMGLQHGAYCVGCCWMLMLLLFVGGVMNLLWVAALAILSLLERTVGRDMGLARGIGVALASWGVWLIVAGL